MANPEMDNYCDIPLTERQIDKLISDLKQQYGPNEELPIGEIECFLKKKYCGKSTTHQQQIIPSLTEGMIKRAGVNEVPKVPKPNLPPPAQCPRKE
jgi:hypothetical protein